MRLVATESASESAENMDGGGLAETTISVSGELSATRGTVGALRVGWVVSVPVLIESGVKEAAVGVEVELTLQMLTLGLKDSK